MTKEIFCCECKTTVKARLISGKEVYSHRKDLHELPFWKCDKCKNFVGCHHKTKDRTKPLGCIPNAELKNARKHIHKLIDPIWKSKRYTRNEVYKILGEKLGYEYHTAEIRTIEQARKVWRVATGLI